MTDQKKKFPSLLLTFSNTNTNNTMDIGINLSTNAVIAIASAIVLCFALAEITHTIRFKNKK